MTNTERQDDQGRTWYLYTCCWEPESVPDQGQNCGDYWPECSQDRCTSPSTDEGSKDCWAGSPKEPCTCSEGEARETGAQTEYKGETYFEYSCCDGGSNVGEECGNFEPAGSPVVLFVILGVLFSLCVVCLVCGCICWRRLQRRRDPGVRHQGEAQPIAAPHSPPAAPVYPNVPPPAEGRSPPAAFLRPSAPPTNPNYAAPPGYAASPSGPPPNSADGYYAASPSGPGYPAAPPSYDDSVVAV